MSLEPPQARQQGAIPSIGHNSGLREFNRYRDLEAAGLFRSRMALWRAIQRGDWPPGVKLGGNLRLWSRDEVTEALAKLRKREEEKPSE